MVEARMFLSSLANLRGWRTPRRLVVVESDDWGAVRLRNQGARSSLVRKGFDLDTNTYDRYDGLECRADLELLFEVLASHKDAFGNFPAFTFNTVMGNPNFERIRSENFQRFVHEPFFESYRKYHGDDLSSLWATGMKNGLIRPQFHAREHVNAGLWLRDLRNDFRRVRDAFDYGYFGLSTGTSSDNQSHYQAAYWPESAEHLDEIETILIDGLSMFQKEFGCRSRSFIACNYVLPRRLESALASHGVFLIQGNRGQLLPSADGRNVTVRRTFTGMKNTHGQLFTIRNVRFEPHEDGSRDWVSSALREIRNSFRFRKPAVVCSHRVNYSSALSARHRDRNLKMLNELLGRILSIWPDVEFVHSDDLLDIMRS